MFYEQWAHLLLEKLLFLAAERLRVFRPRRRICSERDISWSDCPTAKERKYRGNEAWS
jgi:hypothetical protein